MIRKSTTLVVALTAELLFLPGCTERQQAVSNIPMIDRRLSGERWQLITYQKEKITHETAVLENGKIIVKTEAVYVDKKSQFVYQNGKPITTYNGEYIYWNRDGQIINKHLKVISEDQVFIVNGKPMKSHSAMRLRDLHKPTPIVAFASIGKSNPIAE